MAAGHKSDSVISESTLQSPMPLIAEDNYFDILASADYSSASTVEYYAKQWASSVSKRYFSGLALYVQIVLGMVDGKVSECITRALVEHRLPPRRIRSGSGVRIHSPDL